jgi:hypothetical protein
MLASSVLASIVIVTHQSIYVKILLTLLLIGYLIFVVKNDIIQKVFSIPIEYNDCKSYNNLEFEKYYIVHELSSHLK